MKKRRLSIEEYKSTEGACTIIINNARYQKNFTDAVGKIVKHFLVDDEVVFGFYRTDGVNLTLHQQRELEKEIPEYFQKKGEMQELSTYLTVARIASDDEYYSFIPKIFDYYLETIMFNPKKYNLVEVRSKIEEFIRV